MDLVFYTRVSTEEQGNSRNGLEAQLEALRGFTAREGGVCLAHYEEVISGAASMDDRPMLRRALAHARQTKATLLVAKLDRLSRSVAFISQLMNESTRFATVEDGLEAPPLMLHMKAVIAEHERRLISERTKAALQAKRARGEPLGVHTHKAPTDLAGARAKAVSVLKGQAYTFALHISPVIKRMQGAGMTYAQIADELNAQGNPTARGGKWYASTVCNLLKRLDSPGE